MAHKVRRVITGHDANGKAIVKIDEVVTNVNEGRPGRQGRCDLDHREIPDQQRRPGRRGPRQVGTTLPGGTVFRVVEFSPGVQSRNHRTDSIDYAVVMAGEIDMDIDGAMVHLKAGDVLVQRGTIHNWINNGTAPCIISFALLDAKPVTAESGKVLNAVGYPPHLRQHHDRFDLEQRTVARQRRNADRRAGGRLCRCRRTCRAPRDRSRGWS